MQLFHAPRHKNRELTRLLSLLLTATILLAYFPAMGLAKLAASNYDAQVQQMYVAYYGRPGDPGGVQYWADRLEQVGGNWIADLVNAFGTSAEYMSRFGTLNDEQLIDNLFQQLFNRVADEQGRAFYIDLLGGTNLSGLNPNGRQSTLAQIALDIANGAQNEDLIILQNKLHVSEYFTAAVSSTGQAYGNDDIAAAVAIVATVSADIATVEDAKFRVANYFGLPDETRFGTVDGVEIAYHLVEHERVNPDLLVCSIELTANNTNPHPAVLLAYFNIYTAPGVLAPIEFMGAATLSPNVSVTSETGICSIAVCPLNTGCDAVYDYELNARSNAYYP